MIMTKKRDENGEESALESCSDVGIILKSSSAVDIYLADATQLKIVKEGLRYPNSA